MNNQVTDEMIDYILCAAFEGGLTYWVSHITHDSNFPEGCEWGHEVVSKGQPVTLHLLYPEDFDSAPVIDRNKMLTGIKAAADNAGKSVTAFYDNHDADDADNAVQFAAFGELVYG